MTEHQWKELLKQFLDNGNRTLSTEEKERLNHYRLQPVVVESAEQSRQRNAQRYELPEKGKQWQQEMQILWREEQAMNINYEK